jgi:hypothetical protein
VYTGGLASSQTVKGNAASAVTEQLKIKAKTTNNKRTSFI